MSLHLDYVSAVEASLSVHGLTVASVDIGDAPIRHAALHLDPDQTEQAFPDTAGVELRWSEETGWALWPHYAPHTNLTGEAVGAGFPIVAAPDLIARWVDVIVNGGFTPIDRGTHTRRLAAPDDDFENQLRAFAGPDAE